MLRKAHWYLPFITYFLIGTFLLSGGVPPRTPPGKVLGVEVKRRKASVATMMCVCTHTCPVTPSVTLNIIPEERSSQGCLNYYWYRSGLVVVSGTVGVSRMYSTHTSPITNFFSFRRNAMRGRQNETLPLCFSPSVT